MTEPGTLQAVMLLADHAAVADGKLYINGGGWSRMPANVPAGIGLAIKLLVPWNMSNRALTIGLALLTDDSEPVVNEGNPVSATGKLEVGRPPGLRLGVSLDVPLAMNFGGLSLPAGGYRWEFRVNDSLLASVWFEAVEGGVAS